MTLRIRSKEEAGRKLSTLKKEIDEFVRKIPRYDGILLLLCLEDALENLEMTVHKYDAQPEVKAAVYRFIYEFYYMARKCIELIDANGSEKTGTIRKIPEFIFYISFDKSLELP